MPKFDAYAHLRVIDTDDHPGSELPLETEGGGGDSTGMDQRVTRLEEWAKLSGERFTRIEDKLDKILTELGRLPTREAVLGYAIGGFALAAAVIGIIIGAMGWLETRASRVDTSAPAAAPMIIQLPAPATQRLPAK